MPVVTGETIQNIAFHLLCAAGALEEHAIIVAEHLADANLAGHDSHGIIRLPMYLQGIKDGRVDPKARPEIVNENASIAQIDGRRALGQVVATFATELAIGKARNAAVSLVTMCNQGHTGRIGAYPEMAAKAGMAAIMFSGRAGGGFPMVAPFGGREARLGTNPIAMSFPSGFGSPVLLDFATSMAAMGKLRVQGARGQALPEGWLVNKDGAPSTDPNDFFRGGALLPIGGLTGGHKGYALSFMIALFAGVLAECACTDMAPHSFEGATVLVIDLSKFAPLQAVRSRVDEVVRYVKDTPPMEGFREVLYPGEIEARTREERRLKGIEVEETTWEQLLTLLKEYGLEQMLPTLQKA